MYKKGKGSFYKHLDVFVADIIMVQVALILAYALRGPDPGESYFVYLNDDWLRLSLIVLVIQIIVGVGMRNLADFIHRSFLKETGKVIQYIVVVWLVLIVALVATKTTITYSRLVLAYLAAFMFLFVLTERTIMKRFIIWRLPNRKRDQTYIIFIGEEKMIRGAIEAAADDIFTTYKCSGAILTDRDLTGQEIEAGAEKVPVLGYRTLPEEVVVSERIDEAFIYIENDSALRDTIIDQCLDCGIAVHRAIADKYILNNRSYVEKFLGGYVITSSIAMATPRQLFIKRCVDIASGIVGLAITGVLFVVLAPVIKIKDPSGPIFFKQVRVGRGGMRFEIYKFRSMYSDAEERKAELEAQNEMDGPMFKVQDDSRILGDFGRFIRHWSIDEFPQFLNVLKGDMSLVGTRPPTEDEVARYEGRYMKRLSMKPGITGLWQVSGRNEITDFEEVVRLDVEYIRSWSLLNDFKIICKTFKVVLLRKGAK